MIIQLPHLEPWQKDLIELYNDFPKEKIFVTKAVRQVGKSTLICLLGIMASLKEPRSASKIVSKTFKAATELFEDTCNIAGNEIVKRKNASDLKIVFINDSFIEFSSAEQGDNLRGFTVKRSGILAVDEAAYTDDDVFYSVLLPMTNVYGSDVFIFSTPAARQGFFYDLLMQGLDQNDPKVISIDWTKYDTSKYLSKDTLEIYRKKLPYSIFRSQFLGEFLDNNESVFSDFNDLFTKNYEETGLYYFGIDWSGQGQCDYTAISIFNNKKQMVDVVYFNDLDETQTLNRIIDLALKWKPKRITVETNSIGAIYYGLLQKMVRQRNINTIVQGFTTTNDTKDQIISGLQVNIQNKDISLKPDDELERELNNYQLTFSKTGKRVFNARQGFHDDLVMATAICLNSIESGQYLISFV